MDKVIFLHYVLPFLGALMVGLILTVLVKKFAESRQIVDKPSAGRKIHQRPIPLLGGLAVYLTVLLLIMVFRDYILDGRFWPGNKIHFQPFGRRDQYYQWFTFRAGNIFLADGHDVHH